MDGSLRLLMALAGTVATGCLPVAIADSPDDGAIGTTQDLARAAPGALPDAGTSKVSDLATSSAPDLARATVDMAKAVNPPDLTMFAGADLALNGPPSDMAVVSSCIALTGSSGSGHHNAGQACLNCHDGNTATLFSFGGTLYNAVGGGAPVAGATVEVIDANNAVLRLVTATNGNFYTSTPVAFPVTTRASGCPTDKPMIAAVQSGDCNSCHNGNFRVHLP